MDAIKEERVVYVDHMLTVYLCCFLNASVKHMTSTVFALENLFLNSLNLKCIKKITT